MRQGFIAVCGEEVTYDEEQCLQTRSAGIAGSMYGVEPDGCL